MALYSLYRALPLTRVVPLKGNNGTFLNCVYVPKSLWLVGLSVKVRTSRAGRASYSMSQGYEVPHIELCWKNANVRNIETFWHSKNTPLWDIANTFCDIFGRGFTVLPFLRSLLIEETAASSCNNTHEEASHKHNTPEGFKLVYLRLERITQHNTQLLLLSQTHQQTSAVAYFISLFPCSGN